MTTFASTTAENRNPRSLGAADQIGRSSEFLAIVRVETISALAASRKDRASLNSTSPTMVVDVRETGKTQFTPRERLILATSRNWSGERKSCKNNHFHDTRAGWLQDVDDNLANRSGNIRSTSACREHSGNGTSCCGKWITGKNKERKKGYLTMATLDLSFWQIRSRGEVHERRKLMRVEPESRRSTAILAMLIGFIISWQVR